MLPPSSSSSPLSIAIGDIAAIGWNAEPSDGRNRKPTQGLNILVDDNVDVGSVSVGLRQTLKKIFFKVKNKK